MDQYPINSYFFEYMEKYLINPQARILTMQEIKQVQFTFTIECLGGCDQVKLSTHLCGFEKIKDYINEQLIELCDIEKFKNNICGEIRKSGLLEIEFESNGYISNNIRYFCERICNKPEKIPETLIVFLNYDYKEIYDLFNKQVSLQNMLQFLSYTYGENFFSFCRFMYLLQFTKRKIQKETIKSLYIKEEYNADDRTGAVGNMLRANRRAYIQSQLKKFNIQQADTTPSGKN